MKKIPIFDQNHGLTPLQKFEFFPFFYKKFLCQRIPSFLSKISANNITWPTLPKNKVWKKYEFLIKTMD